MLARVANLFDALDPVPAGLVDRVQFGITLDALQAEIAELQRTADLAGVRSGATSEAQTVTFTSASLTTMVTITPVSADRARIDGWARARGGFEVEMRTAGHSLRRRPMTTGGSYSRTWSAGWRSSCFVRPAGSHQSVVLTPSIEI